MTRCGTARSAPLWAAPGSDTPIGLGAGRDPKPEETCLSHTHYLLGAAVLKFPFRPERARPFARNPPEVLCAMQALVGGAILVAISAMPSHDHRSLAPPIGVPGPVTTMIL